MAAGDIGQRQTRQRDAILRAIRDADGPLTVDEIHRRARRRSRRLGIATVYRTIKLLLESEHICSILLSDGELRYEAADLGHHHHFRCLTCEVVFDVHVCPMSIPRGTTLPGGFRVQEHEVTLYGTCPKCS